MTDLFEQFETLPDDVQDILNRFNSEGETYENCAEMLKLLKEKGYTFEYGLDAVPYNLTRLSKITVAGGDVVVTCPCCNHWECMSADEQRHHIQTFDITEWREDVEGRNELSEMVCHVCKGEFLLEWDYENVDEENGESEE